MSGETFYAPPPSAGRPKESGYFWIKFVTDIDDLDSEDGNAKKWISLGWTLIYHDRAAHDNCCMQLIATRDRLPWCQRGPVDDWIVYEVGPKVEPPKEG